MRFLTDTRLQGERELLEALGEPLLAARPVRADFLQDNPGSLASMGENLTVLVAGRVRRDPHGPDFQMVAARLVGTVIQGD